MGIVNGNKTSNVRSHAAYGNESEKILITDLTEVFFKPFSWDHHPS